MCGTDICERIHLVPVYRILEHIGTPFYYKQDSSMPMSEIIFYDLFIFNIPLTIIPAINNNTASANSLSMYILGAINFHCRRIWHEKFGAKTDFKSLYGTGFCSMCHGYKCQLTVVYQWSVRSDWQLKISLKPVLTINDLSDKLWDIFKPMFTVALCRLYVCRQKGHLKQ